MGYFLTNPAWQKELSRMKALTSLLERAQLERKDTKDHGQSRDMGHIAIFSRYSR
jgi:hypothetical protein